MKKANQGQHIAIGQNLLYIWNSSIVLPIYRTLEDFNTGCLISQPRVQQRGGMCGNE